jgi:hypothetical protein
MLRICLIVVIVAALGTLAVSQLKVAENIKATKAELDKTTQDLQTSQKNEAAAKKSARESRELADKVTQELSSTKEELQVTTAKAQQQEARAQDLETKYNDTLRGRNEAQAKLAEFEAFGMSPPQIRDTIDRNRKLTADMEAVNKENLVLNRNVQQLATRLQLYEGEKTKVDLPVGLKGKVLAVDPKYDFIVLDIGADQGVRERGEMLVSRSGKLVAKVRIVGVQANRSVADVMPDWRQADIMEGDAVLVGL